MKRIFVIGDSISIQYGPFLAKYLGPAFCYARKSGTEEALRNLDIPQGANGGTSHQVLQFLQAASEEIKTDILLVNCGLHDLRVGTTPQTRRSYLVPLSDYTKNLRAIAAIARQRGWEMVWMRTTPCHEHVHNQGGIDFHRYAEDCAAYNACADKVMHEAGVPLLDLFGFTNRLGGDEIYKDHVHFTEPVQQQQAAFIAGWLTARYP